MGSPPSRRLCGDDDKIDPLIPPTNMVHVTDADSSQAVAIEEVRLGRHLVIQGPPGTGKSQTITNLIATAVKAGKKVLFVAEKMAALEVVHSRLERLGLGPICLELHSSKANKKTVLEEIARTLALGRPKVQWSEERTRIAASGDRPPQPPRRGHEHADRACGRHPLSGHRAAGSPLRPRGSRRRASPCPHPSPGAVPSSGSTVAGWRTCRSIWRRSDRCPTTPGGESAGPSPCSRLT